jgi:hypothetical protein
MKLWIGPRVAESTRCRRNNPALRGLIRAQFDPRWWPDQPAGGLIRPWRSGLIRSRLDPVVGGLTRARVNPAGGRINPLAGQRVGAAARSRRHVN